MKEFQETEFFIYSNSFNINSLYILKIQVQNSRDDKIINL